MFLKRKNKNQTEFQTMSEKDAKRFWRQKIVSNTPTESVKQKNKPQAMNLTERYLKTKTFLKDHWHLLIKSAAENHLRIQKCKQGMQEGENCNLDFSSYSELKRYQKKVRLFTYSFSSTLVSALAVVLVLQIFIFSGARGASYHFQQTAWNTPSSSVANHNSNQTGWSNYVAKDSGVNLINSGADAQLLQNSGIDTKTSDTDFNAGTKTNLSTIGTGAGSSLQLTKLGTANTWQSLADTPSPITGSNPYNTTGGQLAYDNNGNIFALKGRGNADFWAYNIDSNAWSVKTSMPVIAGDGSALAYDDNGNFFATQSGGQGIYKYNITSNAWSWVNNYTNPFAAGAAMTYDGNGNMYFFRGAPSSNMYRYNIAGNSYTAGLASAGSSVGPGGALVSDKNDTVYFLPGYSGIRFYKYTVSSNTSAQKANIPEAIYSQGQALVYDRKGYVFLYSRGTGNLYRYDPTSNVWSTASSDIRLVASNSNLGGSMTYDGKSTLYVAKNDDGSEFWKYDIYDSYKTSGTFESSVINLGQRSKNNSVTLGWDQTLAAAGGANQVSLQVSSSNETYSDNFDGTTIDTTNKWSSPAYSYGAKTFEGGRLKITSTTSTIQYPGIAMKNNSLTENFDVQVDYDLSGLSSANIAQIAITGTKQYRCGLSKNGVSIYTNDNSAQSNPQAYVAQYVGSLRAVRIGSTIDCYIKDSLSDGWVNITRYQGGTYISGNVKAGLQLIDSDGVANNENVYFDNFIVWGNNNGNTSGGFFGSDGTSATSFSSASSGAVTPIVLGANYNGSQYFRYKATLNSSSDQEQTPSLDAVRLNYSYYGNSGPVALYHLDGTVGSIANATSISDSSGYNNHGTSSNANGTGMAYATGKVSQAVTFDGSDDYINIPKDINSYAFNTAFSVDAWIYPTSSASQMTFFSKYNYTAPVSGVLLEYNSAAHPNAVRFAYKGGGVNYFDLYSNTTISPNNWYHIVAVYDPSLSSNNASIYINGIKDQNTASSTSLSDSSNAPMIIGGYSSTGSNILRPWLGMVDEVAVYNRALSDAEIEAHYAGGSPSSLSAGVQPAYLVSSKYDTSDTSNVLNKFQWTQTVPTGTSVSFKLRTSADNATWSNWVGPNSTSSTSFTDNTGTSPAISGSLASSSGGNKFVQYRAALVSNGNDTPTLSDIDMTYVVNAPPEVAITSATQDADGKVTVNYTLRDIDTDYDTFGGAPYKVRTVNLQYCTANCAVVGSETWTDAVAVTGNVSDLTVEKANSLPYTLVWNDPKTEYAQQYNAALKIRLKANDGEQANNYGYGSGTVSGFDTKNPTNFAFTIDHTKSNNNLHITKSAAIDDSSFDVYVSKTLGALWDEASKTSINQSNFTGSSYDYTFAGISALDPAWVYVGVKDAKSNTGYVTQVTLDTPSNVVYYDISNEANSDYREFISWKVVVPTLNSFAYYEIWRSTNGTDYSSRAQIGNAAINYYLDSGLNASTHYYYKITAVDSNGNVSLYSSVVDDTPNGQGGSDVTPPTISSVRVPTISKSTTSAKITWDTDELSDSAVAYSAGNTNYDQEKSVVSMTKSHSIVLTGLIPSTTYHFKLKSRDTAGNLAQNDESTHGLNQAADFIFQTPAGPAISGVTQVSVSNNQATISWQTNIQSSAYVVYSDTVSSGTLVSPHEIGDATVENSPHTKTINGLNAGTRYYYYVKSLDSSGNVAIDDNGQEYYSFDTTNDTTPPTVTLSENNPLVKTDAKVALAFSTNKQTQAQIIYKEASESSFPAYPTWNENENYNKNHVVTLENLKSITDYDFQIRARDINGNVSALTQSSFTTLEKQISHDPLTSISSPQLIQRADVQAVVSISANTNSTAILCLKQGSLTDPEFADCVNENPAVGVGRFESAESVTHIFDLQPLAPSTTYTYRIAIKDAINWENVLYSNSTFETKKVQVDQLDAVPLTEIKVKDKSMTISQSYAFFDWLTDVPANMNVGCSTSADGPFNEIINEDLVNYGTIHTTKLINLIPNTKYYCKIVATDKNVPATPIDEVKLESENYATKRNVFSFTSAKEESLNHDPLTKIENIENSVVTDTEAVIKFDTDQAATCKLEYGSASGKYDAVPLAEAADAYNKFHSLHLLGLIFKTQYFYKITCQDNLGTIVSSAEKDFTTKDKLLTGSEWGANNGSDIVPPAISNVKVANTTGESVTITWDTDEVASSGVRYGIASVDENAAADSVVNKSRENYAKNHTVVINNLVPATKYLFVVSSADFAGNIAESNQDSFSTGSVSSLSSIKVESKNLGEATITWQTSNRATSIVEYGLTTSYGEKKESTTQTKDHQINLSSLNQGETYHYRVKGKDENGQLYASSDQTFEPKSPPQIKDISINDVTEHGATISFTTSVPTDANITYTDVQNKDNTSSQGKAELSTEHKVELKNLDSGVTYTTSISVRDEQGTQNNAPGKDFTTGKDENPPKIDQVRTDSALTQSDKVQTIINWKTDEQATTSILYKETRTGEEKEVKITDNLTTGHVAVITTFKSGTVYYFKAKSIDASGNEAVSNEFALLTPKRKENIIQVIINNFQDIFGWAKF